MVFRRFLAAGAVLCLFVAAGCSSSTSSRPTERHEGPKVNIADFKANTTAYRGKTITLGLKVDETIAKGKGQTLREYTGKDVRFAATGPKGERMILVIKIPAGLTVPDVGDSDEVRVTFVCTRGNLQQGNEARSIALP